MNDLERLVAIEAIKNLMARRCKALDDKDWASYQACHAHEHVSLGTLNGQNLSGAALIEGLRGRLDGIVTVHHVHSPQIDVTSPSEARGIWALEDRLFWKEGAQDHWMHGWGHYHDTYGKRDGQWLFTSRRLTRVRVEWSPGATRGR
jgi:hypothetical protein